MLQQTNRLSLQSSHKIFCILTVHLLLTHSCRGQSQLIGSSQPIAATVGDDIILPCQLQPAKDVAALIVEWTRPDLSSIFVHVWRDDQDLTHDKHPSYKDRTSLFIDELKQGNISLKLSKVKLSDGGKYKCHIPEVNKESFVELVVASGAISSPVINVTSIDRDTQTVVLQCESKGWYPQPEVLWLDSEGNLLSAGPTETVRDDFFKAPPSSSPVIIGVAVSLVVFIVFIVAVFFFVWKWRQNMIKTRRRPDETEGERHENLSKSGDPEMHPLNAAETDGEMLTVNPAVSEENNVKQEKKNKHTQAGKNSTESPVNVEVDPNGNCLLLLNVSKEDLKLEGWKLRVKVNDQNPITFTFDKTVILRAYRGVTIWAHGCAPRFPPPSDLKWKELNRWTKGDKLLVELINCHEEIVTTTQEDESPAGENSNPEPNSTPEENNDSNTSSQLEEKPEKYDEMKTDEEKQENKETQGSSQHNDTNPASQNSTEVFVKVSPSGNYLRLTNKSKEDLKLEGWKLRVKVNDQNPITFTFDKTVILRAYRGVTIWAHGCGPRYLGPSDLTWKELKRWARKDKLLVELINCHEEIVTTTKV